MEAQKPPVRVIGRYAVYGAIASGGMATVHLGRLLGPVGFSRTVAIKRLHPQYASDPEFASMFLDEARLVARIRHPHVVPTLDVVATEGELFLVMEYIPGESLSRLVRAARATTGVVPLKVTVAILSGVLQGLHAAHEAKNERGEPLGIVHRDVSPQNVLVGSDGQARVLDFGVAKAIGRVQTTREGQLKGKLSYMAPEQLNSQPVDRRSDIYSAAVVLWETITGERLFSGDSEGAVIARVLEGEVEAPSKVLVRTGRLPTDVPAHVLTKLDKVTLRGLAPDKQDRFANAREMALALEDCMQPATSAQVGAWVEEAASAVLKDRANHVAVIESESEVSGIDVKALSDMPTIAIGSNPSNPLPSEPSNPRPSDPSEPRASNPSQPLPSSPSQPLPSNPSLEVSSQLSSISAVSPAQTRPSSGRRPLLIGALGGAVVVGGLVLLIRLATSPAPLAPAPSSTGAVLATQPVATASAAPSASIAAEPLPAASASAAPLPSSTPKKTRLPGKPQPTTSSCNPPYTWDAQGQKHYKPECL